ncbi:MAG: hypothetical protein WCK48_03750 [bacterium]
MKVLFDGTKQCQSGCECGCPVVTEMRGIVTIQHPGEPGKGAVKMTAEEWNNLLKGGKPAQIVKI